MKLAFDRAAACNAVVESAAEAAHDRFYEITADTSDLGYVFTDERTKETWRDVAMAVLRAVSDAG